MAEYHCQEYECFVTELPCPWCDAEDHKRVPKEAQL